MLCSLSEAGISLTNAGSLRSGNEWENAAPFSPCSWASLLCQGGLGREASSTGWCGTIKETWSLRSHQALQKLLKLKLISYWEPGFSSLLPLQSFRQTGHFSHDLSISPLQWLCTSWRWPSMNGCWHRGERLRFSSDAFFSPQDLSWPPHLETIPF